MGKLIVIMVAAVVICAVSVKLVKKTKTIKNEVLMMHKNPCYEGELPEFGKHEDDTGLYIRGSVGGRTAVLMRT